MTFQNAKCVWSDDLTQVNQYVGFKQTFHAEDICPTVLKIRADNQYAAFLNGHFVGCGQYTDYPFRPCYDTYELPKEWLKTGSNLFCVLGYCQNEDSSTYRKGVPGIIFEITAEETVLMASGPDTRYTKVCGYQSGPIEKITAQLSFTFHYDRLLGGWADDDRTDGFSAVTQREPAACYEPRPIKKLDILPAAKARVLEKGDFCNQNDGAADETAARRMAGARLSHSENKFTFDPGLPSQDGMTFRLRDKNSEGVYLIIDLHRETAGFANLDLEVQNDCLIEVGYGEHLEDLRVRTHIDDRNFAFSYRAVKGRQQFTHYMKRIAGRYLQLHIYAEECRLFYAGILPVEYPVDILPEPEGMAPLERQIYGVSVDTLRLCMHEHYEDCPWREQALYAMDARSQMLCGYYAFGEYPFAKASLRLLGEGIRRDGLLELCAPARVGITIPSFSLVWIVALAEYGAYSGDWDGISDLLPTVGKILQAFGAHTENGLVAAFEGNEYWNFYEWSDGLSGTDERHGPDAAINGFYALALKAAEKIYTVCGRAQEAEQVRRDYVRLKAAFDRVFWVEEKAAFCFDLNGDRFFPELVQALALCGGLCDDERGETLRAGLTQGLFDHPCTLSYLIFKYDAVLQDDRYRPRVREDIGRIWGAMLQKGATSFWETADGAAAFGGAGSLCHGWSAIPAYFYHRIFAK